MSTPLTEQIRAYFGDVERHQGGIDVATLRHDVEEGEVITVEGPQVDWRPPNPPISRPRWPIIIIAAATLIVIAGLIVSDVRESRDIQRAVAPPVANGLIAFVGESPDPATIDIFVVAPDGTGLRPLTSTPEFVEYAPAWSPDGSRLAFVRASADELSDPSPLCVTGCQLVVVDPSTGVETFSAEIPPSNISPGPVRTPLSLTWSPDGRAILMPTLGCVPVGREQDYACGAEPSPPRIADLETAAFTTLTHFVALATWSPDGEWLLIQQNIDDQAGPLLLVPADLIATGNVDIGELPGVRPLQEPADVDSLNTAATVEWMPDSSAILDTHWHRSDNESAWIDVVTVADGERHTLIDNGFDPVVSPDGHQIAYRREDSPGGVTEIWVANANGSDQQRVAVSSTPPAWSPDSTLLLLSDQQEWFTVRPDGTHRTALGFRVHTFTFPGFPPSGVDWQPVRSEAPASDD